MRTEVRRAVGQFLQSLTLLSLVAISFSTPAFAQGSEDVFTRRLAERLRAATPGMTFEIVAPLKRRVSGGATKEINLGRVFNYCASSSAQECEESIARFVAVTADTEKMVASPIAREQLRLAVRSSDFCDYVDRTFPDDKPKPIKRDYLPALCIALMADFPTQTRTLDSGNLGKLGLDTEAAWALAQRQTLAEMPEPKALEGLDDEVVLVSGFDYAPSLMLSSEGWRAAAARHGELLGAVPASDTMLVVRRARVGDLDRLKAAVRDHFDTAERGVSPRLYRWTDKGWVALPERERAAPSHQDRHPGP